MAIELVDGHAGRAHVGSDDLAVLNAATYGVADCVFDVGERLRCTMDTANRALVASGAGMVGGRRWRVDGQESLSVESGTQGQRRNDLVVARYGNDGGVESVHLEVVRGESGPDGPRDPAVGRDGLALWRIPIDGINAGEPQRLFRVADTLGGIRRELDGIEVFPTGRTGWWCWRHGGCVTITFGGMLELRDWEDTTLFTLPRRFRPYAETYGHVIFNEGGKVALLDVMSDEAGGAVRIRGLGGGDTSRWAFCSVTYAATGEELK